MSLRCLVAGLLLVGGSAAVDDVALVQGAIKLHDGENWQGGVTLQSGDMGMDITDIHEKGPPVPLVEKASDFMIPALAGSQSLTKKAISFKLWRVNDNKLRTFKSQDKNGFFLYNTQSAMTTKRGRTTLIEAGTNKKIAVIWMDTKDAIKHMVPLPPTLAELRDEALPVTYTINAFRPYCAGQGSVGDELGTGEPLYAFAKVSKNAGGDKWTVRRIACESEEGIDNPKWQVAYTLGHHGLDTAMDAVAPEIGVIGTADAVLDRQMASEDSRKHFHRATEAWLAAGEDPALFSAALMISQMPGTPTPPKERAVVPEQ